MPDLCSWSLVELYRVLGSSTEAHKAVLASHSTYANLVKSCHLALTVYGVMQNLCSWSLVELYRALGSSIEAHKAVLASHPMYANLMERSLAKVVLQRLATLEKFCQVGLLTLQFSTSILDHSLSKCQRLSEVCN